MNSGGIIRGVMLEECTPRVLRAILSAHHHASGLSSPEVEPEHLLLGVLHESTLVDTSWALLVRHKEWFHEQIYAHSPISTSITPWGQLRWSNATMRVLEYAIEETERLSDQRVGMEHLLLGVLREQDCFAAKLLNKRGIVLETARTAIASRPRDQEERPRNPALPHPSV